MVVTGLFNPAGDGKLTGSFQACFGVFVAQSQDSQRRVIALFFYGNPLKDTVNRLCCIIADGSCPVFDPDIIPWGKLELIRHIFRMGRILVPPTRREAIMRGYAGRTAVDLHGAIRNLQVNTLPGVLVRTRVPVILKDDMVVNVYLSSIDPRGDLIRDRRQWMQERLLIQVRVVAAPFTFLETLVVESVELFCNGSFQILKAVKSLIS